MEIFNIGALEFLFILLLAFIILGPKKAVEFAGKVGSWVKDFVKSPFWKNIVSTSKDIKDIPRKIMDDTEIQNTINEIDRSTKIVKENLKNSVPSEEELKGRFLPDDVGENRIYPGDRPENKEE
jgi:sec-independent protein translocase protein TatB